MLCLGLEHTFLFWGVGGIIQFTTSNMTGSGVQISENFSDLLVA